MSWNPIFTFDTSVILHFPDSIPLLLLIFTYSTFTQPKWVFLHCDIGAFI